MNLYDSVNTVLKRLDDYPDINGESIWSRSEVEMYLQDGYNAFCRQTKCILDLFYPENIAQAGNYVGRWELGYYTSGMIAVGLINFSGGYWERDYSPAGAVGPVNSTQPWEADYLPDDYVFPVSVHPIPEGNVAIDRATYDYTELEPEWTRWVEWNDRSFQTTQGTPTRFLMDRDGIGYLRIVPAGSGGATVAEVSGTYGLLRDADDDEGFGTWAPLGTWGGLREIPEHFPMGGQYGIPRRLYHDDANVRVEYFRLGYDLDEYPFQIPTRMVKYVEYYAQAKCLERDGPGQELALSGHFLQRFQDGVRRMVLRLTENKRAVVGKIGNTGRIPTKPSLARLPFKYGQQIRRGY